MEDSTRQEFEKLLNEFDKEVALIEISDKEKSRAVSDTELINNGAKYVVNKDGHKRLELTDEQIKKISLNDKKTVLNLLKEDEFNINPDKLSFKNFSPDLRADREVVLAAIRLDDLSAFKYASSELQSDKEFVLKAIELTHGNAFKYASLDLRDDMEVVLAAVKQQGRLFRYVSYELQSDREFVMHALNYLQMFICTLLQNFKKTGKSFLMLLKTV